MTPIKYYQILTPDNKGVIRPFEVNQFGESDPFFASQSDAENFIKENFLNAQTPMLEPADRVDLVLIVCPIFLVRFKPVK